jgi:gamma-glutamylcyclotransferase (GGCT)/AIG2-like uncharacterized protein YtfP
MLHFAYGSNLNAEALRAWCAAQGLPYPLGPKVANAWLPDHEPFFETGGEARAGGVLSLRLHTGQATPGVLFEVDEEGLLVLDRREGAPERRRRQAITILLDDASVAEATAYVVPGGGCVRAHEPPEPAYLATITAGLEAHGLPAALHEAAALGAPPPTLLPRLFTYGTLRRGGRRHGLIAQNLLELEPALARGRVFDLGGYPGMVADVRGGIVRGELCTLRDVGAALTLLDQIEGFAGFGAEGSLLRRALLRAVTREGRELLAWAYLWARAPQGTLIVSGDWLRR